MTRSFCRLWVHAVFVTKERAPFIAQEAEHLIYDHLAQQLRRYECVPLIINGMPDHVHLLFLQNYKMSLAEIFHKVKGETSFWINSKGILPTRFTWQDGSGGFTVSEQNVAMIKNYIRNQKSHHAKKTFQQEYEEFLREYNMHPDVKDAG